MQSLKRFSIIGLFLGLVLLIPSAHALYSPVLSNRVRLIKQHIVESQAQNGVGSLLSVTQTIVSQSEERRKKGQLTGLSGPAAAARKKIVEDAILQTVREPLDGLFMSFGILPSKGGGIISDCLRDEIWTLESLKDLVGQEMVKAYMLADVVHGDQLQNDYDYLVEQIDLLKRHGNNPDQTILTRVEKDGKLQLEYITLKEYFFGPGAQNYYYAFTFPAEGGCPQGDFSNAFQRVSNSAKTLATLSTGLGQNWNWGSIWEMAQARAKQRADQWFAANQVSLTLGGGQGGRQLSVVKGDSWAQRVAQTKTELKILKNLLSPVFIPFSHRLTSNWLSYQRVDGSTYFGDESSCVYSNPETGLFYPCTPEQLEAFKICDLNLNEAKEQGLVENMPTRAQEKAALRLLQEPYNCRRLVNKDEVLPLTQRWQNLKEDQQEGELFLENEVTAFYYQLQFDGIGEGAMNEMVDALAALENEIKRGVEAAGDEQRLGLPTCLNNMKTMMNRHCLNKNYGQ